MSWSTEEDGRCCTMRRRSEVGRASSHVMGVVDEDEEGEEECSGCG